MKEQILESPFCKKEFLELVDIVSEVKTTKLSNYAISDSSIVNIGDRNFVDYRPDISIDPQVLKDNNISSISFDSLHFFQVQNLVEELDTKSVKIKKSDVAVNLILPKTYEEYLESLSILSTAFCYENDDGCYLYNSSKNNEFNSINPGIVLNDLIIQQLIDRGMAFFDFLKGTERYKYDLGGNSVQLYDLAIEL